MKRIIAVIREEMFENVKTALLAAGCVLACAQKLIPNNTGTISGIIQGFTLAIGSLLLIPLGSFGQCFGVSLILILVSLIAIISAIYCIKTKLV